MQAFYFKFTGNFSSKLENGVSPHGYFALRSAFQAVVAAARSENSQPQNFWR